MSTYRLYNSLADLPPIVLLDAKESKKPDWFHGGNPPCNRHKKHKK